MKNSIRADVKETFDRFPRKARNKLLQIRRLIYRSAATTPGVSPIEETLKWGEPAYLTPTTGSGSTIRLGWKASDPDYCHVYFICTTNLVDSFRTLFPALLCDGNRAIRIPLDAPLEEEVLARCLGMALTYHLDKRTGKKRARTGKVNAR
ncbi:MAG: DUF1801 domain-containing protein [Pseudomonadota bacterium]